MTISEIKMEGQHLFVGVIRNITEQQALDILKTDETIDLIFNDTIMLGGIDGYDIAQKAKKLRPYTKVLLTSGFTNKLVSDKNLSKYPIELLSKPYRKEELARYTRNILNRSY